MLIVMNHTASDADVGRFVQPIREMGYDAQPIPGKQRTAIGLVGNDGKVESAQLESLPGVLQVVFVTHPYQKVSREWRAETTIVELANGTHVGGDELVLMVGHAPWSRATSSCTSP
jgi:3-deoxy-7-phosphoheptulonate synthase